jgi:hypothetical protein
MKRHWILGVLWLMGCGAGSPTDDGSDSTLEAPLTADDDISSDDLADSELASEFIPSSASDDEAADDATGDGAANDNNDDAPEAGSEADDAPGAAPGAPPVIVIGAGGEPWQTPGDGVVVWCHASVPLGCPAIEPAPNAGRLIVVTRSGETGEFEHEAPGEPASGGASAPVFGTGAAPGTPTASGVSAPSPAPPRGPLPVDVGGSLPPLPGTCVAIAFAGAGAAGESASDASPAAGERVTGTAPLPVPGESAGSAPLPPLPGFPALPPSGGCISVAFPGSPAPLPGAPPNAGAGPIGVPLPPSAGGCVGVAFAAASGEDDEAGASQSAPVRVGSAAPHASGMPFLCAANPPTMPHPARPGRPSPNAPRPGAPLPPSGEGGGHIEVHHTSDGAPATDEASIDEVR